MTPISLEAPKLFETLLCIAKICPIPKKDEDTHGDQGEVIGKILKFSIEQ